MSRWIDSPERAKLLQKAADAHVFQEIGKWRSESVKDMCSGASTGADDGRVTSKTFHPLPALMTFSYDMVPRPDLRPDWDLKEGTLTIINRGLMLEDDEGDGVAVKPTAQEPPKWCVGT